MGFILQTEIKFVSTKNTEADVFGENRLKYSRVPLFYVFVVLVKTVRDERIAPPPSEQNILSGAPHKPFTGQRLVLTFAWDPKCQRAKRLS